MIFHNSVDPIYFEKFYPAFLNTFKKYTPDSCYFSLNYVGIATDHLFNFCKQNNISLTVENLTFDDINNYYNVSLDDSYGYYAINRWCTIPTTDQSVFVSDVDIFAINEIDVDQIKDILTQYDAVNITRVKPNGLHGGMASIVLSEKICYDVKKKSKEILNLNPLRWDLDVLVREYIYKTFKIYEINNKVLDITKKSHKKEILDQWLILSKGGRNTDLKIERINEFLSNNNRNVI